MATMDIFKGNAFSMVSMTEAIERRPYQPQWLGQLGLFTPKSIRTTTVGIEEKEGVLSLIQTSQRGAPLGQRKNDKRRMRNFNTVRIAESDTIYADEIQNIRAFGSESELKQVITEVASRLDGPTGLRRGIEMTHENMRFGAVQGKLFDADGSIIYDWFSEFDISQPGEINFNFVNAAADGGDIRKSCDKVVRQMKKASKGAWVEGVTSVTAICGDDYWDALIGHSEVRSTYLNYVAASELREGTAYGEFKYGGITWKNYRGTDDGSTIALESTKAKFFPVNAPGVFQTAYSPAESFQYVNTPGKSEYAMIIPDRDRDMFVDVEVYSYPLFMCTNPGMLQRAKLG